MLISFHFSLQRIGTAACRLVVGRRANMCKAHGKEDLAPLPPSLLSNLFTATKSLLSQPPIYTNYPTAPPTPTGQFPWKLGPLDVIGFAPPSRPDSGKEEREAVASVCRPQEGIGRWLADVLQRGCRFKDFFYALCGVMNDVFNK